MPTEYLYDPITDTDGIRLLELHPALHASEELHCSLRHTTLSQCDTRDIFNNYTALSYVWGSPDKTHIIWINDGKSLPITANLFSALHDIRHKTSPIFLWADAICINQLDGLEKAMQISLMAQIYAGALHTIIHLGSAESDGHEPHCLDIIRTRQYEVDEDDGGLFKSLTSKEWFSRTWVFQELVFSSDPWVQYGRRRVRWDAFYQALNSLQRIDAVISEMQQARARHHGIVKEGYGQVQPENTMFTLVGARRGLGVTDPRDMIFAHVGFASDGQHEELAVDYSKAWTQIYKEAAGYFAKKHGLALVLGCAISYDISEPTDELPQWVPNWTHRGPSAPPQQEHITSTKAIWCQDQQVLSCPINFHDIVIMTSSTLTLPKLPKSVHHKINSKLKKWILGISPSGIEENRSIAEEDIIHTYRELYQSWRDLLQNDEILPPVPVSLNLDGWQTGEKNEKSYVYYSVPLLLMLPFYHPKYLETRLKGKSLAFMASGKLALVPSSTKKNDIAMPLYKQRDRRDQFVFRPLPAETGVEGQEAQENIRRLVFAHLVKDGKGSGKKKIVRDWPVKYCEYVGECFLDVKASLDASKSRDLSENFIMALP